MDIREIIETYNEYIKKVPNGVLMIAEKFRDEKSNEALAMINDFSEGTLWLSQASNYLNEQGVVCTLNIDKINEYLIEINDGLEKEDYLLVADLFEYEVAPFFTEIEPI